MRLFDPNRHEPLIDADWDAVTAMAAIRDIAVDALRTSRDGLWPSHPLDETRDGETTLYLGAAGTLLALSYLTRAGAIGADERIAAWSLELPARYRASPDTGAVIPSYFLGEAGILVTAVRARRRAEWLDELLAAVTSNTANPTLEALWGAPGTMLAAVHATDLAADDRSTCERFRGAFLASFAALSGTWRRHDGDACDLWEQDLYGSRQKYLGPAHGFAGNVHALLRRPEWLGEEQRQATETRALDTLRATAIFDGSVDGAFANWPPVAGRTDKLLVQWCHGAPGMITAFGAFPANEDLDALLARGGELTWLAGPVKKGPSLCHGTAGNGAAFLTLFARTGDERWLHRARCFAMHAIEQLNAARATHGRGRYGLWTGDLGVAVFLQQCLSGTSGMPSLDF